MNYSSIGDLLNIYEISLDSQIRDGEDTMYSDHQLQGRLIVELAKKLLDLDEKVYIKVKRDIKDINKIGFKS